MRKQRCITVTLNLANSMQHSVKRTNRLKKQTKGQREQREQRTKGNETRIPSIVL